MWSSLVAIGAAAVLCDGVSAFILPPSHQRYTMPSVSYSTTTNTLLMKQQPIRTSGQSPIYMAAQKFEKIDDDDDVIIAFMDESGDNGIDCYVDSYATVDGVEYTIGIPCDYTVALCYFEGDEQLVPIELDDPLMDDIFPIAEGIIEDEFGEELALLRTPQTLTLVGVRLLLLFVLPRQTWLANLIVCICILISSYLESHCNLTKPFNLLGIRGERGR